MVHVCVSEGGLKDTECEEGSLFQEGGRTPVFRALGVHTHVSICAYFSGPRALNFQTITEIPKLGRDIIGIII